MLQDATVVGAEKIAKDFQRRTKLLAACIIEEEGIDRRLRPVWEHFNEPACSKLGNQVRQRQLDETDILDGGRDGDARSPLAVSGPST